MGSKKSQNHNPINGARKVQQDLNGTDYRIPRESTKGGNSSELRKDPHPKKKQVREATIRFVDELGYDEKTKTFKAHFRIGKKTYTLDTGKDDINAAQKWLSNQKISLINFATTGIVPGLTIRQALTLWMNLAPIDTSRPRVPNQERVKIVRGRWEYLLLKDHGDKAIDRLPKGFLLEQVEIYKNNSGPMGPHTIGGVRSFVIDLNTPFRFVHRMGWVSVLPTLPRLPRMDKPVIHFIPPHRLLELMELFDRYVRYDLYAMLYIRMMAFSGLRTKNARLLRKEFFKVAEGMFDTGITKNGFRYRFPIPEDVKSLIARLPGMDTEGPLFPGTRGARVRGYRWCLSHLKLACKKLNINTSKAFHALRASYAVYLLRSGVDVTVVKELLGHETLVMVLRYAGTEQKDLFDAQARGREFLHAKAREARQSSLGAR